MKKLITLSGNAYWLPLFFLFFSLSCKKEYIYQTYTLDPTEHPVENSFYSFKFLPAENGDFINDVVELNISGTSITGRIPYYTNIKKLVASFEISDSSTVVLNGIQQESGVTENDFSTPLNYQLVSKSGDTVQYVVNLVHFTGLPVITINTVNSEPITSKENYVNASIRIDGAGKYPDFQRAVKIRGRGNFTWTLPKKPFKLKFDEKESLLGEAKDKEWCLLANYTDKTNLRNALALYMGASSNLDWTPKSHFAELFLNNVYMGTYQLCEQVKVANTRVNVSDDGFLVEVDQLDRMTPDDVYFNTSRLLFNIKDPDVEYNDEKFNFIKEYITQAEEALYGADFKDPVKGYAKYLDVESFVEWYLINEITRNFDANFYSSCFMNIAPNGKLKMGPIWDFDLSLGNTTLREASSPEGYFVRYAAWIFRLFQDPAFVEKVRNRFAYFKSKQKDFIEFINNQSVHLQWSIIANNNKWKTLYEELWPVDIVLGSYENEIQYMKNWLNARMSWMETSLNNGE